MASARIPFGLEPYRQRLNELCARAKSAATQNLADLQQGGVLVVEDVLSNTLLVMQFVRLLSTRFAVPLLRAKTSDRLALHTLAWLHAKHPRTAVFPPAFTSGDTGVWPMTLVTPIYFLPAFEQDSLLFQSLLFHEFGHLLYACHTQEMDDLVGELQRDIGQLLLPPSQRNDRHDEEQADVRGAIVARWHTWTQELFCDAVGLVVGGPSFLNAFSGHLSSMSRGDFYRDESDLIGSTHPVTWLRIRLLASRARTLNWNEAADRVESEWALTAAAMRITEDYHGFYDERFRGSVEQRLDDMLTEADPHRCTADEASGRAASPVGLLNLAWLEFHRDPEKFGAWETARIGDIIDCESGA